MVHQEKYGKLKIKFSSRKMKIIKIFGNKDERERQGERRNM